MRESPVRDSIQGRTQDLSDRVIGKESAVATLATPTIVSVEEYLRNPNWERCDYVDGVVEERGMPTYDHSAWMNAICFWFNKNAEQWSIRVRPAYRNKIRETRYRIPDVSILDFVLPKEVYVLTPPIAAFANSGLQ